MVTCCATHALTAGRRCDACESDWRDEAPIRRNTKLIFAPAISMLTGGVLWGLLLPVSLGGLVGEVVMYAAACGAAVGAGLGACGLVERSARALFLRERAGGLPPARLLPAPRHH